MVVDGGEIVADWGVFVAMVGQLVGDALHDVTLDVNLIVVGNAVALVDEDLDVDVWITWLKLNNGTVEARDSLYIVILSVDDPDESSDLAEDCVYVEGRVMEVKLTREIPDLKVHERAKGLSRSKLSGEEWWTYSIASF